MLEVLVKAVLQVSQQSRAMAACLWTTFVVPLSWGAVKAAQMEAKRYSKVVEETGRGHRLGPPHPHVLRAFVEAAAAKAASEEPGSMEEDTEWQVGLRTFTADVIDKAARPEDVALLVPYFRVKVAWAAKEAPADEHKAILMWFFARPAGPAMAVEAAEQHMAAACVAAGGEQKIGQAPRGVMDRLLERWLDKKRNKGGKKK